MNDDYLKKLDLINRCPDVETVVEFGSIHLVEAGYLKHTIRDKTKKLLK
jgi:hypothetical protein